MLVDQDFFWRLKPVTPQDVAKTPQDAPKAPQDASKMAEAAPKTPLILENKLLYG